MIYKVLSTVEPPSYFGLPEGAKTAIKPAPGRELVSAVLDTHSGNSVRYGTLPDIDEVRTDASGYYAFPLDAERIAELKDKELSIVVGSGREAVAEVAVEIMRDTGTQELV